MNRCLQIFHIQYSRCVTELRVLPQVTCHCFAPWWMSKLLCDYSRMRMPVCDFLKFADHELSSELSSTMWVFTDFANESKSDRRPRGCAIECQGTLARGFLAKSLICVFPPAQVELATCRVLSFQSTDGIRYKLLFQNAARTEWEFCVSSSICQ